MKLQDILKWYREEHGLSTRALAKQCGLSSGYISTLESGKNPRTGEPLYTTLETLEKIANGMGMSVEALFGMMGENMPQAEYVKYLQWQKDEAYRQELMDNPNLRMLLSASSKLNEDDIKYLIQLAERMNRE